MEKLGLNEIREAYLKFFESKDHLRMKSFSLVPKNDPSLLLIPAGMAPLKKYFTGEEKPPRKRVTTCQKCIRTPDIERVGKTDRHGTFFEMLGNFSFGDYFKEEATAWAWEFVTKVMKMPVDRLWVTIYQDDDEAFEIWTKKVGVSPDRIVRMGKEDNFWEIGVGPCGPCSEIYFDRGEKHGCGKPDCKVGCDCDRYVEFWNLVFTQFHRDEEGNYHKLAHPNIDTGMGLERIAAIMQDVGNLFEVDTVKAILDKVCAISGKTYHADPEDDVSIRVITDHIRSTTFMVSDGILPSNEGRGYVLRRLLRRAARHGKLLGIKEKFLYKLCDVVIEESKEAYPELAEKQKFIREVISTEEDKFEKTIDQGLIILNQMIDRIEENGVLDGASAFKLYDTYGFPLDLTQEILQESNVKIDEEGFYKHMEIQREKARSARNDNGQLGWDKNIYSKLDKDLKTEFVGYDNEETEAEIKAIISENEIVGSADGECVIITDRTVCYGESGGQVGDHGILQSSTTEGVIYDTQKTADGKILHFVRANDGEFRVGDQVTIRFDKELRESTKANHSATHLLQKALREVLGSHVEQAGSYVTPERLRFDFSHMSAMTEEQLLEVEQKVNNAIMAGLPVEISQRPYDEAVKMGAMALFGEKYADIVRVVKMGDYSVELCGGCHVSNTAKVGLFKILSESGVAAGVRRIEAITGLNVLAYIYEKEHTIKYISSMLKVGTAEIVNKITALNSELKEAHEQIDHFKELVAKSGLEDVKRNMHEVGGVKVVRGAFVDADVNTLRKMGDALKDEFDCVVGVFAAYSEEKVNLIAVANKEAVKKGIHCGNIVKEISKLVGGSGGGRPDSAQAGGKDSGGVDNALLKAMDVIKEQVNQ